MMRCRMTCSRLCHLHLMISLAIKWMPPIHQAAPVQARKAE
jgi:hypothetical protein